MKFTPINGYILVRREDPEEQTTSGLVIPTRAQERSLVAEVVAVGEIDFLEVGDRVLTPKYEGDQVVLDEQEYLLIRVEKVLGVIE